MSRAQRTARGAAGAVATTVLAGASHALAGGEVTWLALLATSVLALPLCVALAGRVGSLWRLSLGVGVSQFVYHWSFSSLGVSAASGSAPATTGVAAGPHAAHWSAVAFVPGAASADAAGWWMWVMHAVAALVTVALIHRGEQAVLGIFALLRLALPRALPREIRLSWHPAPIHFFSRAGGLREGLVFLSAITHRGPPTAPCTAS